MLNQQPDALAGDIGQPGMIHLAESPMPALARGDAERRWRLHRDAMLVPPIVMSMARVGRLVNKLIEQGSQLIIDRWRGGRLYASGGIHQVLYRLIAGAGQCRTSP